MSKGVNQDGINYYNNLINELLANGNDLFLPLNISFIIFFFFLQIIIHSKHYILAGIQPWITILHLDIPQALQDAYGGFMSPQIV